MHQMKPVYRLSVSFINARSTFLSSCRIIIASCDVRRIIVDTIIYNLVNRSLSPSLRLPKIPYDKMRYDSYRIRIVS